MLSGCRCGTPSLSRCFSRMIRVGRRQPERSTPVFREQPFLLVGHVTLLGGLLCPVVTGLLMTSSPPCPQVFDLSPAHASIRLVDRCPPRCSTGGRPALSAPGCPASNSRRSRDAVAVVPRTCSVCHHHLAAVSALRISGTCYFSCHVLCSAVETPYRRDALKSNTIAIRTPSRVQQY